MQGTSMQSGERKGSLRYYTLLVHSSAPRQSSDSKGPMRTSWDEMASSVALVSYVVTREVIVDKINGAT